LTADLSPGQKAEFAARGLPQPGQVATAPVRLANPARLDVPSTLVCCSFSSEEVQRLAREGNPMFAATLELHDLDFVDLPGGHWPMWAQPDALAARLHEIAGQ
jgi:pimeloyl-ACP methyl ester carboxylesterase